MNPPQLNEGNNENTFSKRKRKIWAKAKKALAGVWLMIGEAHVYLLKRLLLKMGIFLLENYIFHLNTGKEIFFETINVMLPIT